MQKELCITTDIYDDFMSSGQYFDEQHLDEMVAYAASMGVTRHEWVLDTMWNIYEDYPGGFDLLKMACDVTHRHGMRFDVVFKIFEGALGNRETLLPPCMPHVPGVTMRHEAGGLFHAVRPFLANNPHMRMARDASHADTQGRIAAIRLVKNNDKALTFAAQDISIWTSAQNGNGSYQRYEGKMSFTQSTDWRHRFPYSNQPGRIVTLGDLDLPADTRFIRIHCDKQDTAEFSNDIDKIIELVDENNQVIPHTYSQGPIDGEVLFENILSMAKLKITRYMALPQVQEILEDRQKFLDSCKDMYQFEFGRGIQHTQTLDSPGDLVIMRGKCQYVAGVLNPAYPEVRQHWLEHIQYCIDRNVDGVNIRMTGHNRPSEPWRHGFNPPVTSQMKNPGNTAEASSINGSALTQFLSDARDMLHAANKQLGVHLNAMMFQWDDRTGRAFGHVPHNIEWQWKKWIADIADYVEFRGMGMLRPENMDRVIDQIGLATREADIPFIIQSNRGTKIICYDGPYPALAHEMLWARNHPDITCYNLYETNVITRINAQGRLEGSKDLAALVQSTWHLNTLQAMAT